MGCGDGAKDSEGGRGCVVWHMRWTESVGAGDDGHNAFEEGVGKN